MSATFMPTASRQYDVRVPSRLVANVPDRATYARRRVVAALFISALVGVVGLATSNSLADRGGGPASATAIGRPPSHIVQPGDTLWSIAERYHGGASMSDYVDTLVEMNGGPVISAGQVIILP